MRSTDRTAITTARRQGGIFKRMVRYLLSPGRVLFGVPVAWVLAWFNNGHRITEGGYWLAYGAWFGGMFLAFWLLEAYRWAGGRLFGEPRP